ncbi:HNH endonuclease signature motif containing protein [Tetragenococcus solitarius]|uniref:Putative HNH nuclease YajD n=1 Tax=Tetragenococcus solitarius TaxID=71453 RepID=A0ABN3YB54_9ENTE|nr:HNH endonuclease signature motif containing protein [Tetragenococcus solitarius]
MKPKKLCQHASCHELIDYNETYCAKHQPEKKRGYADSYQYKKNKYGKYFKFYHSKQWRKLSELYRYENPCCEICLANGVVRKADVVDHVIELRDQWDKRLDKSNLMSLCHSCHYKKTKEERQKREVIH